MVTAVFTPKFWKWNGNLIQCSKKKNALGKLRSETKVILIGKSGNGKSSIGNTLLGHNAFSVERSLKAVTEKCEMKTGSFLTHNLSVVDTPGLFDTRKRLAERALEIQKAVEICPGPHAFLLVFSAANRMTEEERCTIDLMRVIFGERVFDNAVIVFTRGSEFASDAEFQRLWEKDDEFKKLVEKCGDRVVKVENKYGSRDVACRDILNTIQCTHAYKCQYPEIHKTALEEHLKNYNGDRDVHKEVEDLVDRLENKLNNEIWKARFVAGGAAMLGTAAVFTGGASAAATAVERDVDAYRYLGIAAVAVFARAAWGYIERRVLYKAD